MNLYELTADKTLWSEKRSFKVVAEIPQQAISCLTVGSDSLWVSVAKCELIEKNVHYDLEGCYENAGGYVIE